MSPRRAGGWGVRARPRCGGWPFRRGAAIWLHSPRRARARVSRLRREEAEGGGRWPLPSVRDKGVHARLPHRLQRSGPDPSCRRGSLGSGGWARRRGRAPDPKAWIALAATPLFSLRQVSLTETGELHLALSCLLLALSLK